MFLTRYSYIYLVDVGAHVAMSPSDVTLRQYSFWPARKLKKHLTSQSKRKQIKEALVWDAFSILYTRQIESIVI